MERRKLLLSFEKEAAEKAIVCELVRRFDLGINIFRAKITPEERGYMVLDVTGESDALRSGMAFLRSQNVEVDTSAKGVCWNESLCTHCTSCVNHCPTRALHVSDRGEMRMSFDSNECVECLACIKVCPFGACSSMF